MLQTENAHTVSQQTCIEKEHCLAVTELLIALYKDSVS